MTKAPVSVVVVSRDRPKSLALCLLGISQLFYANFEVVVVANKGSLSGLDGDSLRDQIKIVEFDRPNISAARNLGVSHAGGEVIAFIDDDAVPEPTWLDHLTGPFEDETVVATGGYVLGRNGISFQWKARMAFPDGASVDLPIQGNEPQTFDGEAGRAIRTEGTNMAIRRQTLVDLGGFDEAFCFYMDETDLNMRIAAAGLRTTIVPLAQVHHGYEESVRRTAGRVPRDLTDIGRSSAIFARKHGADVSTSRISMLRAQRQRLIRTMVEGRIVPSDVRRLKKTLELGWHEGALAEFGKAIELGSKPPFEQLEKRFSSSDSVYLIGRFWQKKQKLEEAHTLLSGGKRVTLFLFSLTALYHHTRFVVPGLWVQTGGQFGRSVRNGSVFRLYNQKVRYCLERNRIAEIRGKSAG